MTKNSFLLTLLTVVVMGAFGLGLDLTLVRAENVAQNENVSVDPPIDVIPEELLGFRLIARWDFDERNATLNEWTPSPNLTLEMIDGALLATANDPDPHFISPRIQNAPAGDFLVRLRARRTTTGFAQIFTAEEAAPEFHELRSTRFTLPESNLWCESVVRVRTSSPIIQLRFDLGLDSGRIEIDRIELFHAEFSPLKFGVYSIANGVLRVAIRHNSKDEPITLTASSSGRILKEETLNSRGELEFTCDIPKDAPFATIDVEARAKADAVRRRFFAINRERLQDCNDDSLCKNWKTLESVNLKVHFATDGSGALIYRNERPVAALFPLYAEDVGASRLAPVRLEETLDHAAARDGGDATVSLRLVKYNAYERRLEYSLEVERERVGALNFTLNGDELLWRLESPVPARAPAVKILDEMTSAVLPGVELLERGERSSSTADVSPNDRARYAPSPLQRTAQFATIITDAVAATIQYDEPNAQIYFAVPDFLDGDATCAQVALAANKLNGKLTLAEPKALADVILDFVARATLPTIPSRPRSTEQQESATRWALERGALRRESGGWASAVGSGLGATDDHFGSDFISTLMEVGGDLPELPRLDVGGANLRNYASLLRLNRADLLAQWLNGEARVIREKQLEDGSFRYNGKYLRGSDVDYASGDCGSKLVLLAEHWRLTGNAESLHALLRGLEFANRLSLPRGAQTWELSLHTPDLLAAAWMCYANTIAYEATGELVRLNDARRWAALGIPFVYLWQDARFDKLDNPVMAYATIPAYGATDWIAPCWIGTPVQWCGVNYACALLRLALHDSNPIWRTLAQGIVVSAERQVYPDSPYEGLLPDSFTLEAQQRNPLNINPCALHMVRRMLDGIHTNVTVVDVAGRRVVSPFHAVIAPDNENAIEIQAQPGERYQLLIDGEDVLDVESKGKDCVFIPEKL